MDAPTVARIGSNDPSLRALSLEPNDFEDVEEFMQVIPNTQGTAAYREATTSFYQTEDSL